MKTILLRSRTLLACAFLFVTVAVGAADNPLQTAFDQGRAAYYAGDFARAKLLLTKVLAANPNHYQTRAMLASINAQETKQAPSLKSQCAAVTIAKFDVNQVSLEDGLQALAEMTKNHSGGRLRPNFVVKNPELAKTQVTLSLANAPVDEIVRYLADLAKARVSWEAHAVVFAGITD